MSNSAQLLSASADAVVSLGSCATDFAALDDAALLSAQELVSTHRRHLDTYAAWIAGEIARRSDRSLGYAGLAQRSGFLSAEALIQSVTKTTRAEASKFVNVGTLMVETEGALAVESAELPWQAPLAAAVNAGGLSVDAAEAIRRGLGVVDEAAGAEGAVAEGAVAEGAVHPGVTAAQLRSAVEALLGEVGSFNADQIFRRARDARDELDADAVARREKEQHEQRFLKVHRRIDGMVAGSFLYGPEDGALLLAVLDEATGPRRGGPRFVDPTQQARAEAVIADPRSTEQLAADAFLGLLRLAVDADPSTVLGARRPTVRVIVSQEVLATGHGHGYLENTLDAVSITTVQRHLCDTGVIGIVFDDDGQSVNVGRDQRLFQYRQRIGLAVRDGGCRHPDCDRPASWCEAHHINHWARDGGKTDLQDGVLLCRRHHLLLHNNHWQIVRKNGTYWLKPPRDIDSGQTLIEMPSKNPVVRQVRESAARRELLEGRGTAG